jgi:superfamily II DNA or RNA helicase
VDDRVAKYGHLVVDESHHLSARSFELVARRAKATYVTGLSATVTRKDGHHPIVFMQCGPVRFRVDAKKQPDAQPFTHHVSVRPSGFYPSEINSRPMDEPHAELHRLYEALRQDERRNASVCADVVNVAREGRSPLVLTERTEHGCSQIGNSR